MPGGVVNVLKHMPKEALGFATVMASERQENPDIADTWNTVRKMAEKRAKVAATLNALGASDIFGQDLDESHLRASATATVPSWKRSGS